MKKAFLFLVVLHLANSSTSQVLDSLFTQEKVLVREDSFRLNLLLEISSQLRMKEPSRSLAYANMAVELSDKLKYDYLRAKAYSAKARIVRGEEGIALHKKAIELLSATTSYNELAFTYAEVGFLYSQMENTPKALENYYKSLDWYQKTSNPRRAAFVYSSIGLIYTSVNDPRGLEFLEKAIAATPQPVDSGRIVTALINLGSAYFNFGHKIKAIDVTEKALSVSLKARRWREAHTCLNNISLAYLDLTAEERRQLGLTEEAAVLKAKEYSEKSLEIWIKEKLLSPPVVTYNHLARIAHYYNKPEETIHWLRMSKKLIDSTGQDHLNWNYYLKLSAYYEQVKKYDSALYSSRLAAAWKDSLRKNEKNVEIVRKDIEIEFGKIEDSLRQVQLLTGEKLKNQTLLTYQREQEIALGLARLDLSKKEKEITELAYEKTLAELNAEQSERKEKEKLLVISEQEKNIQAANLRYQQAQLDLKEKDIQSGRREKAFYLSGLGAAIVLFGLFYYNIRNRQRTAALIAAEKIKTNRAETERRLAELEMHGLRAQLNPHFMFNSLNAIQRQILQEDNENALHYLNNFAKMLRQLLENAEQPFLPLEKELGFIRHYLSMEQLRMPELEYAIYIDPKVDSVATTIPNMILQPYLENAIWHGLSMKEGSKHIILNVDKRPGGILITIEDNGIGRRRSAELKNLHRRNHSSKGMELLQKRFELIRVEYGSQLRINIEDIEHDGRAAGTKVTLAIPDFNVRPQGSFKLENIHSN